MTTVRVDLRHPDPSGIDVPSIGQMKWTPTLRRHIELETDDGELDYIVLPEAFVVDVNGSFEIEVDPTTPLWAWRVVELVPGGSKARYFAVPDSDTVVDYADLVEVDLATLEPQAQPEAAWWLALQEVEDTIAGIEAGTIDPEVVEAAVEEVLETHVDSPTPHPVYDEIPSLTLIFENGLA